MRLLSSLLLAGAAVAGLSMMAPTLAQELDTHYLTVQMPGGGVETIEYTGKLAPKISFKAVPIRTTIEDPFAAAWPADFGLVSFAALDQISAEMDRQMDAMMRQAEVLSRLPQGDGMDHAVLHQQPSGTSFSMVSQSFGNNVCTHVTRITQTGADAKPQVVSQTLGNCAKGAGSADSNTVPSPNLPELKQAGYSMPLAGSVRSAL